MSGRRTSPRRAFTPSFEAPGGCECYPAGGQVAMLPLGSSEVNLLAGGGMVSFVFARAIRTGAGSTPPGSQPRFAAARGIGLYGLHEKFTPRSLVCTKLK
jgi:hypothetical protein